MADEEQGQHEGQHEGPVLGFIAMTIDPDVIDVEYRDQRDSYTARGAISRRFQILQEHLPGDLDEALGVFIAGLTAYIEGLSTSVEEEATPEPPAAGYDNPVEDFGPPDDEG